MADASDGGAVSVHADDFKPFTHIGMSLLTWRVGSDHGPDGLRALIRHAQMRLEDMERGTVYWAERLPRRRD